MILVAYTGLTCVQKHLVSAGLQGRMVRAPSVTQSAMHRGLGFWKYAHHRWSTLCRETFKTAVVTRVTEIACSRLGTRLSADLFSDFYFSGSLCLRGMALSSNTLSGEIFRIFSGPYIQAFKSCRVMANALIHLE